jgi:trypsin-like peptidase
MQRRLFAIPILFLASPGVEAACIDPATLTHSTVSITRHFDDDDKDTPPGVVAIRGTGWFLSPTTMVTVEHVAAAMKLSDRTWKELEVRKGEGKQLVPVRIQRIAGAHAQKIAVLELQTPVPDAPGLQVRAEPLAPEERVVSLGYPEGRLRVAGGRFVQYGDRDRLSGAALLELYDGNDRLVLDHGASGAPVLDCDGRVVAVVSNLFTTTMQFMSRAIRTSTAWGSPNVVSVPVPDDLSRVQ